MNNLHASINEVRRDLIASLTGLYPAREAVSVSRIILEYLGYAEQYVLRDPSNPIDPETRSEIKKIVYELNKNRPVQYVLGETEFHELKFFVDENVLIPRPETEEMVMNILLETSLSTPRIIDIGTGSGCIAVSLARSLPGSSVTAIEKEPRALDIAKKNAEINKVNVDFVSGDILEPQHLHFNEQFDIVVSNPPYVTMSEKAIMEKRVTDHEPEQALYVPDEDPLLFYRAIIDFAEKWLKPGGAIWVEINEHLGKETRNLFSKSVFTKSRLMKDIHGKERFIKANRSDV